MNKAMDYSATMEWEITYCWMDEYDYTICVPENTHPNVWYSSLPTEDFEN